MALVERRGYRCTHDAKRITGETAVVNTCGFIADAKEESINTILELVEMKKAGRLRRLYVMGCLSERYRADLEKEIDGVDGYYGKFDYEKLLDDLEAQDGVHDALPSTLERHITTPKHYAYLKISEGCDRHCAYCAIPIITGHHRSRPMDEILREAELLAAQGVKELQVIAQELTYYGVDIDGRQQIAELTDRLSRVKGIEWIRLHYAYPAHFPWDLMRVMRERPNVCNYLDIALQHISDHILERMRRHVTKAETLAMIERMRREVPGIHLRTTLMVGFPGETDEDFEELMDFTRQARFERMGAFAYSAEDGTYSGEHYEDDVPEDVKQERLSRLMQLQQNIAAEVEAEKVGKTMKVIIDRREGDWYVGRNEFCSPEVDPEVLIPAAEKRLRVGQFYQVEITGAEEFDLYAKVITSTK